MTSNSEWTARLWRVAAEDSWPNINLSRTHTGHRSPQTLLLEGNKANVYLSPFLCLLQLLDDFIVCDGDGFLLRRRGLTGESYRYIGVIQPMPTCLLSSAFCSFSMISLCVMEMDFSLGGEGGLTGESYCYVGVTKPMPTCLLSSAFCSFSMISLCVMEMDFSLGGDGGLTGESAGFRI